MTSLRAPTPARNWALFLDIDGTLIDIAERPDKVVVPEDLPQKLWDIRERLAGALALVSGRTLADIDRLMAPYRLACAAEHGAVLRLADGTMRSFAAQYAVPEALREQLRAAARRWPDAIVEEKQFNIVVHYRQAPSLRDDILSAVRSIATKAGREFEVLPARMAFELRHRALNKGEAVRMLMAASPFATRIPVFVGDDVTDEDGFAAATALGGTALDVRTAFDRNPARVREWLDSVRAKLNE